MGSVGNLLVVGGEPRELDEFIASATIINEEGVWSNLDHLVPVPAGSTAEEWLGTRYGTKYVELRRIDASSLEFYCESRDLVTELVARMSERFPRLVFAHRFMHESDQPRFGGWQVCMNGERLSCDVWDDTCEVSSGESQVYEVGPAKTDERSLPSRLLKVLSRLSRQDAMVSGLGEKYLKVVDAAAKLQARDDVGSEGYEWDVDEALIRAITLLHHVECQMTFRAACKSL